MTDERNSLGGRVMRYARVGRAVGGLAARVAGQRYLGFKIDRAGNAADLKAALGGLKGPLMKVAQIMATIPDALPKEYVQELQQLQANAPARSEEHTSELQSLAYLVCRLLLEKKKG